MPCCGGARRQPRRRRSGGQAVVQVPPIALPAAAATASGPQRPLPKHLLRACKDDDAARVAELLGLGLDIEHRGMWGNTPLLCAAAYGSASAAELLVSRGADCTVVNEDGSTPLMLACLEGMNAAVAGMLSRHGGTLDLWPAAATVYSQAVDRASAQTPLRAACEGGHLEIVRMLLDSGVLASRPSTAAVGAALVSAARQSHEEVVLALLEAGVVATTPDETGTTAAEVATDDVAEILKEHAEHTEHAAECADRAERRRDMERAAAPEKQSSVSKQTQNMAAAIDSGLDSARAASPVDGSFVAQPPAASVPRSGCGGRTGIGARKLQLPPLRANGGQNATVAPALVH